MVVQKTSVFPASRETVFSKLQQLETLQYIAKPYATFVPVGEGGHVWTVGSTSSYRFRLFGIIPYGTHTIHIVRFDPEGIRISSPKTNRSLFKSCFQREERNISETVILEQFSKIRNTSIG